MAHAVTVLMQPKICGIDVTALPKEICRNDGTGSWNGGKRSRKVCWHRKKRI